MGYHSFVPLYRVRRLWTDRIKDVELPLFPGYVFCRLDATNRLPVRTAPGVVGIVGTGRVPAPIEENEIEAIHAIIAARLAARPWSEVGTGDRVKIAYGPLRGIEGTVTNLNKREHLVVSITLLQRAISVELDETWVRPAN
jgi:transcription antitermination factor NusG